MNDANRRQGNVYCSQPLVHNRQTRLFHLQHGSWSDEVSCRLEVVDLDAKPAPAYEAISYVWGSQDEDSMKSIRLDGHNFRVGASLHSALRHLRSPATTRSLWADAICIDQGSISERNKQVELMRDIYAGCRGVLIWLGGIDGAEATEFDAVAPCQWKTDFAVWPAEPTVHDKDQQKITDFYLHMEVYYGLPFALRHGLRIDSIQGAYAFLSLLSQNKHVNGSDIPILANHDAFQRIAMAIGGIVARPWWQREWVIQEVVVPPRATLHYGRFVAPWDMFVHAARNFENHRRTCCTKLYITLNYHDIKMLEGFSRAVVELDNLRMQWRRFVGRRAGEAGDHDQVVPEDMRISLRQLLWRFRERDVTDAKDKIFGLLTLVNDRRGQRPSFVDYRCRTQGLYHATVEQVIAADRSLLILAGSTDKTAAHADLPTWVPDWCFKPPSRLESERLERTELFDASAGAEVALHFVGDSVLGLKGGCFDRVAAVAPDSMQYGDSEEEMLAVLAGWQDFVTMGGRLPLASPYPTGETRMAAYWRTLCIDTVRAMGTEPWSWDNKHRYTRCPPDYVAKSMQLWMDGNMMPHNRSPVTRTAREWMDYVAVDFAITSAISGRRLFVTEQAYMGLGPAGMTEGDMVHVMAGGHTPFVTRMSDKSHRHRGVVDMPGAASRDCLSLVGDCYVHGIMDGESARSMGSLFLKETIWLV
ncbi:hypothetical protein Daus18300_014454 [Diaporthe australafricana]|uniref:Heterokaryon incompatibility domain-containing protein n=1 Tax=Diaporthe australafricana TaxID=127596 RepID=A0ABR3VV62_9PEZI